MGGGGGWGGVEIKLVIFADDMTTFVRDKQSYLTLFNVINLFGIHTGLKINHDKTESLLLGNLKESASSLELDVCEFKRYVKILGVYFTYNTSLFHKLNFESVEKSLKELLKGWSWRGLTLIGKVQIIKSFALPKVLYRLTLTFTFTTIQARPLYEAYVLGLVSVQDQTTTPGTPCPTLHEWCVGSLTSHSYLQQGL